MRYRLTSLLTAAILPLGAVVSLSSPPAIRASTPKTIASTLTLDSDGTAVTSYAAPCTVRSGCANGLRLRWTKGPCYDQRTYPPLAVGWFYQNTPTAKYWPIASPCGTGITLQWSAGGTLYSPTWVHAPIKNQDLVRFPSHADGATVYSYGGHNPVQAEWLLNGKVKSTITLPPADDFVWSSYVKTAAAHARRSTPAQPNVLLWGRKGSFTDQKSRDTAPPNADGVQFAWFLSISQKSAGRGRGCRLVNGTYWTDPPVMFEYTTQGALDGRLNLLPCPTSFGAPQDFNMINFKWGLNADSSGYVLTSANPTFNNHGLDGVSSGWFPQPPANADGLYFESDLDDFQSAYWLNGGSYIGRQMGHPAHVRLETWTG